MQDIIAALIALTAPEPNTAYFDALLAQGQGAPVEITHCRDPLDVSEVVGETILCGTVTVPEDHDNPDNGQTVELAFGILKADTMYPAADPLVYLHGGPGIGNLDGSLNFIADAFGAFRANRDVVIFDQRAAGISSGSVTCYEQLTQNISGVVLAETGALEADDEGKPVVTQFEQDCLDEIASDGTDLTKYNTRQNAMDVPMVLSALGYETWNLYGISYGTKLSLEVMRTAPEGVRSVVIDGVAPPWIKLYDTLALPMAESIQRLVDDCAAEEACNAAYPDLGDVVREVIASASAGEIMIDGTAVPPRIVGEFFNQRNTLKHPRSFTPYLPAMLYELKRGGETPTIDMVANDWNFDVPAPDTAAVMAMRSDDLSEQQLKLLDIALKDAEIVESATSSLGVAVSDLRRQMRRDRELGPLPSLFDAELSAALPEAITTSDAARAAAEDYAALQLGERSRERLADFVQSNFQGANLGRLMALVEAMTDGEVAEVYQYAFETVRSRTLEFQQNSIDLLLYACQEDMPFNSEEGYEATTAEQPFDLSSYYDNSALFVFATCEAFEQAERDDWHEVVVSDIPTVSIGSGWDVQTAASWAEVAIEGLTNAQHFFMSEAGHGALVYADCVADMTVAFVNDPTRVLDDSCERELAVPPFYIAPWVEASATAQ